jgi:hypothetical protein
MKNFSSFYSKIDTVVNERMGKKKAQPSKGLVAKADGSAKKQADIYNQVADYIEAIRKQKQELMNGK